MCVALFRKELKHSVPSIVLLITHDVQVKFFDRVKADRNLKQLQSKLKQAVMDGEEELVAVSARPVAFVCIMVPSKVKAAVSHWRKL